MILQLHCIDDQFRFESVYLQQCKRTMFYKKSKDISDMVLNAVCNSQKKK